MEAARPSPVKRQKTAAEPDGDECGPLASGEAVNVLASDDSDGDADNEEEAEEVEESLWSAQLDEQQSAELARCGLAVGDRLDVEWDLDIAGESKTIWWGCTLTGAYVGSGAETTFWRLLYDEKREYGFPAEVRRVVFSVEYRQLVDKAEEADTPMSWKKEGEEVPTIENFLPVGTKVKARCAVPAAAAAATSACFSLFGLRLRPRSLTLSLVPCSAFLRWKGGAAFHAGVVEAVPQPGGIADYTILYDDGEREQDVAPELVEERVGGVLPEFILKNLQPLLDPAYRARVIVVLPGVAAAGPGQIEGIETFWNFITTSVLTPLLTRTLPPARCCLVAAAIRAIKPDFVEACEQLKLANGVGSSVSGDDITKHVLPKIMPKVAEHIRRLAAAAV